MKIRKILILGIVLGAAFFAFQKCSSQNIGGQGAMGQMPPAEVDVVTVKEQEVTIWSEFTGRLEAVNNIQLRPRVSGQIEKVHFKDGQNVKKGDVLFSIDPAPISAELKRADGAKLAANAQSALASTELNRAEKLYAAKAISKQEYDQRKAMASSALANLKAANAEAELAKLNYGYTQVRAPISGKVGRAEVTAGNIVAQGQTVLTTIVSSSPIYANFEVDENTYLRATKPDQKAKVLLALATDDNFPHEGKILGFDNQISTSSGTIRARAIFDNKDGRLIPGLFAKVKVGSASPSKVILLDQKAISTDQDKKFVYVVDKNNGAEYRVVTLGAEIDGKRIITSGLKVGDKVVVNGTQKIFMPGAPLIPSEINETPNIELPEVEGGKK